MWTAVTAAAVLAFAASQAPTASAATTAAATAATAAPAGHGTTSGCAGAVVVQPSQAGADAAGSKARSSGSDSLAALYTMATKRHAKWLTSMTCTIVKRSNVVLPAAAHSAVRPDTTAYATENWSGYQTNDLPAFTTGLWTVPTVTQPPGVPNTSPGLYDSSTWVGDGAGVDTGSGALVQAGTGENYADTIPQYYAWYEIVGGTGDTGGEVFLNSLTISPGDAVFAAIQYPAGVGNSYLGVCDETKNTCVELNHPTSAVGDSAEWIMEATEISGTVATMPDYGSVTFTDACEYAVWPNGSCGPISSGTAPTAVDMYQNGEVVSAPGPLNAAGTGFTDYYL
jgi:hypothetical protein